MNIKIITIHSIPNFGSAFQAYALETFLKRHGHTVETIDYQPSYFLPHTFRSMVGVFLNFKSYQKRKKKFSHFIMTNMNLTKKRYTNKNDFIENPIKADVFISGGDQLWNPFHDCGNDDVYKLAFTESTKMSYGTSMGKNNFSKAELENLSKSLNSFSFVSVRESSSVTLLESIGIKAQHCVDPVLLLESSDYMQFVRRPNIDKYMLVYLVAPSPLLDETIKYISNKLHVKVVLCSGFSQKCNCDIFLKDLGPEEILSYIAYADFVLSASFHATLFSIIFKKHFATLLPDENTNERIEDLLNWNSFTNRIIRNTKNLTPFLFDEIKYDDNHNKVIKEKVDTSKKLLLGELTSLSDQGNVCKNS
ncbi:MAG: polysaccharide pyruvyl transferase family protein [Oscillospiraceae bacterium]